MPATLVQRTRPAAGIQVVTTEGGLAIRVTGATADDARAGIRPRLSAGTDATLYPVDD